MKNKKSITGAYLSGKIKIPVPEARREPTGWFKVSTGQQENNLKNIDVKIPTWRDDLCNRRIRFRKEFFGE